MADGSINIDTKVDTSGAEKGVKGLTSGLGSLAKKAVPVAAVALSVKKVTDAIKNLSDAYKVQTKAEIQLETAAKNNPYLDSSAVKQLKNYASELQNISTVGDETLIPMMATLAASGRNQVEIQDIMRAALDASASGAVDLDTAVRSLNQSYEGNVGTLGRILPSLKNLTTEELKSGKAVKQVQSSFNGMAAKVAESVGATEQLSNAWGDLKEQIGASLNNGLIPFQNKLMEIINQMTNDISFRNNYAKGKANIASGRATPTDYQSVIDYNNYQIKELQSGRANAKGEALKEVDQLIATLRNENSLYIEQKKKAVEAEKEHKEAIMASNAEAEKAKAQTEKTDAAVKAKEIYVKAIEDAKKEIEIRKSLGEEISEVTEKQELFNATYSAFMELQSHAEFSDYKNIWIDKKNAINDVEEAFKDLKNAEEKATDSEKTKSELDKIEAEYKALKDTLVDLGNTIADSLVSSFNSISSAMSSASQAEITHLENEYKQGLMTQEEFYAEKDRLEREAAEKKYKLDMAAWTVQIAQATANTAMAVSKAFAEVSPVLAPLYASIAAANGAAQLGAIIAAKPVKTFATGGIVPGASYSGDNVIARVNSGEMILNQRQQQNMFNALNNGASGSGASVVMPVNITNNTNAKVDTQLSTRGLMITIDEIVNSSMAGGKYNRSMGIAQGKAEGARIL